MRKFRQLFAGRDDVYGQYILTEEQSNRADGKRKGRGVTKQLPLTNEVWEAHLSGKAMLGVVPIRLDGTVSWFAGDIDVYNIDQKALVRLCQEYAIPVVICRSKSGGAHLYCFVNGVIKAEQAIKLMRMWLTKLGYAKSEVFPKQEWLSEESIGNWINLPYFNGDKTERYAYGMNAEKLSLKEFEQYANACSPNPEELEALLKDDKKPKQKGSSLDDAPPCVQTMYTEKVVEGGRNNALTHVGIYHLKSDPDNWRDKIVDANYKIFDEPLPMDEVNQIVRNVAKSKYEYLCKLEPMCSLCDKELCLSRKWGVGPQQGIEYQTLEIDRIVKINADPPLYYVVLNGTSVKMSTDQLLSPGKFRKRVYEVTGALIAPMKERQHEARIQSVRMEVEQAPIEVNQDGQVIEAFEQWCEIHLPSSRSIEEVLRGNPFYEKTAKRIVFRSMDLIAAFKRQKKFAIADRDVWVALREYGASRENIKIRGKQTKLWIYPVDDPWFDLPNSEQF
jgi:hypothetical protein